MAARVAGPGGTWVVRRRWTSRLGPESPLARMRRRFGRIAERADVPDAGVDGCGIDAREEILVVLAAIVVVLLLAFVVIPFLVALIELLVLVLLVLAGGCSRIVFRRPWLVDAVGPDGSTTCGASWDGAPAAPPCATSPRRGRVPSAAEAIG